MFFSGSRRVHGETACSLDVVTSHRHTIARAAYFRDDRHATRCTCELCGLCVTGCNPVARGDDGNDDEVHASVGADGEPGGKRRLGRVPIIGLTLFGYWYIRVSCANIPPPPPSISNPIRVYDMPNHEIIIITMDDEKTLVYSG